MKVYKFGGTSVGNVQRMKNIYNIIRGEEQIMVVLSAMSGTTNALVEIGQLTLTGNKKEAYESLQVMQKQYVETARQLLEDDEAACQHLKELFTGIEPVIARAPEPHTEAAIVAVGEKLSTYLFHRFLEKQHLSSALLDATQIIRLDAQGEPDVQDIRARLEAELPKHGQASVLVIQGFICSDSSGNISNLGRGGSDYSASLFAAALQSEEVQIWTDIDGVQNNDPRHIENTRPVRQLLFDEAAELAYFGAKILHPACVLPAQKSNIPVLLKNTLHPEDAGTLISKDSTGNGFKAVAARDNITAIRIKSSRMLLAYGFLRKVFEVFEKYKTPIDMITTSEVAVSLTIDDTRHLKEILEDLQPYGKVTVDHNKTMVGIVGNLNAEETGLAQQLFSALSDIPIRMISYGASQYNFSILINTEDKIRTLQALNNNLFD
ncbi:MAG: aspartate kinase [Bacteroidales bacterium]|nr:aspartate kinase [Bacteroidales bacterium]